MTGGMTGPLLVRTVTGPVDASVDVPGSKSIANRALVCAALAGGRSVIEGIPVGRLTRPPRGLPRRLDRGRDHPHGAVVDGLGEHCRPGPLTLPAAARRHDVALRHRARLARPGPYVVDGAPSAQGTPDGSVARRTSCTRRILPPARRCWRRFLSRSRSGDRWTGSPSASTSSSQFRDGVDADRPYLPAWLAST